MYIFNSFGLIKDDISFIVGTPELPPLQPQGGMILPNGTDLRHVTVLSKSDWERIQNQLYQHQIEEARLQRIRNEREEQKQRSKDMVKNWGNTIAVRLYIKLLYQTDESLSYTVTLLTHIHE